MFLLLQEFMGAAGAADGGKRRRRSTDSLLWYPTQFKVLACIELASQPPAVFHTVDPIAYIVHTDCESLRDSE